MNYWQNKKQSGHKTPGTPTHPILCAPHECPNQQTPQQNFSELQDHTKKHDLNKIKKHIRYQPRTPTPHQKKGGYQCTVTTSRFTNTHHHNTTHKHAVSKTYWTKHTLEFSNNTPHQQHHHTQTRMQHHHQPVSDTATPFWVTTYATILAFIKKHKLKTLCLTSQIFKIHSISHGCKITVRT